MTAQHSASGATLSPNIRFARPEPRAVAPYERQLTELEIRLRQALARQAAVLRQKEELSRQLEVLRLIAGQEETAARVASLTPRQRQIMELVIAGHPSKNIAWHLGISQRTVENHRASIMRKTGAKCLPELARMALLASIFCGAARGAPISP